MPALFPSISCKTGRIVYEYYSADYDVYRVKLETNNRGEEVAPVPLISSTRFDGYAEYSPDGSNIAFLSSRAGNFDVWVCDREGGNLRRLTSMKSTYTREPHWSPDGGSIAFSSLRDGYDQVFTVGAHSGAVRRLSSASRNEIVNGWSRDGEWIVGGDQDNGLWMWRSGETKPWWFNTAAHAGPVHAVVLTPDVAEKEGEGEEEDAEGG